MAWHFRRLSIVAATCTVALSVSALAGVQTTLYVAPNGSGTVFSAGSPGNLYDVRAKIRTLNAAMTGDIVVSMRGGTYRLDSTFVLRPTESGSNGWSVIFTAALGETPVLSGGRVISGWTLWDTTRTIYRASTPGLRTRQLYVNGLRAPRASIAVNAAAFPKTANGFTTPDTSMQHWRNPTNVEIVSFRDWKAFRGGCSNITASELVLKQPFWDNAHRHSWTMDNVAWIENVFEGLDARREWYLDRSEGAMYYKRDQCERMSTAEVVAPVLERLVEVRGTTSAPVHHIQFTGITFAHSTWLRPDSDTGYAVLQAGYHYIGTNGTLDRMHAAVLLSAGRSMRFERCTFTHLGSAALDLQAGSQDNVVIGNVFTDISGSAVMVAGLTSDDQSTDINRTCHNNRVQNNYIADVGAEYFDNCGVLAGYADSLLLEHNEIADLPYTGVSVGWGWSNANTSAQDNKIRYNYIHDVMQTLWDGGAIYTLSAQHGTEVSHNYIRRVVHNNGLYPDEGSSFMHWHHNVVSSAPRWLHMWTGSIIQDTVENNWRDGGDQTLSGVNCMVRNNTLVAGAWPAEAQAVIDNAGIETPYRDIIPVSPVACVLTNLALGKSSTASSQYDGNFPASKANDGVVSGNNGWTSLGTDANPWWKVDLANACTITSIDVVMRQDMDQPSTRQSFSVQASNASDFSTYVTLASHGSTSLAHQATFSVELDLAQTYRYVRVVKSGYAFFAEVRVFGDSIPTAVQPSGAGRIASTPRIALGSGGRLTLALPQTQQVTVHVYAMDGRLVSAPVAGSMAAGVHRIALGATTRQWGAGCYCIDVRIGGMHRRLTGVSLR